MEQVEAAVSLTFSNKEDDELKQVENIFQKKTIKLFD